MIKNVQVVEKSSGRIIAQYPIIIEIIDTQDEHYFDEAWENAVDEDLVDEDDRNNYDIEIVGEAEEQPPE